MATLLDFQRIAAFTDGDPSLEDELLDLFFATAERYLGELALSVEPATSSDRAARWRATAHSLKGAAGNIGAEALADLAAAAERAAPDPALLAALEATFAATRSSAGRASA